VRSTYDGLPDGQRIPCCRTVAEFYGSRAASIDGPVAHRMGRLAVDSLALVAALLDFLSFAGQ
jgi:hypothetical protein